MSIAIDVLLILIFILFVVIFTKNGLFLTIFKIGKAWLSLFCSIALGPWFAARLEGWFLNGLITKGINDTLSSLVQDNANHYSLSELFQNLPEGLLNFLNHFGISLPALEAEYGSHTYATEEIIAAISERFSEPCVELISAIASHVFCFVVTYIFLNWLGKKRDRRLVFFYIDRVLGFIVSVPLGISVVLALSVLLHTIVQVSLAFNTNSILLPIYNNSYLLRFINEYDVIGAVKSIIQTII